jgi:GH15 family glucan-1,4-alpha-glucosidase
MALDRAVRLAKGLGTGGPVARWARERDSIERSLLEDASRRGWFSQALGTDVPDASALVVPALGFLPPGDPRVTRTLEVVSKELGEGGLIHRYRGDDGLSGGEGAFLLCSFWLVDALSGSPTTSGSSPRRRIPRAASTSATSPRPSPTWR